jgi:hypothetical protein
MVRFILKLQETGTATALVELRTLPEKLPAMYSPRAPYSLPGRQLYQSAKFWQ